MKRGASLVEVILAVSLVGLVILFLLGLLPSTKFLSQDAEHQLAATRLAEELMAQVNSLAFDQAKAAVGQTLTPSTPGFLGSALNARKSSGAVLLNPSVEIAPIASTQRVLQVTVKVEWQARERAKSFRLVRRISSVLR